MTKRKNFNELLPRKLPQKPIESLVLETEGVFYPKNIQDFYKVSIKQIQTCVCLVISGENGVYITHINNNNTSFQKALLNHIADQVGKFDGVWITKGDKISMSNFPLELIGLFATREKGVAATSSYMIIYKPLFKALKEKCAAHNIHVIEDMPNPHKENESLTITVTINYDNALPVSVNSSVANSQHATFLSELRTLKQNAPTRIDEALMLIRTKELAINSYLYNPKENGELHHIEKISSNSCPSCSIM